MTLQQVATVTANGKPFPRYVITIRQGGKSREIRIPDRRAAAKIIPDLIETGDAQASLKIKSVGVPPKSADLRQPLSGRLAGVDFRARVGEKKWSGKLGVRCGSESAYFAAFRISPL